jgi:hypothetical protein
MEGPLIEKSLPFFARVEAWRGSEKFMIAFVGLQGATVTLTGFGTLVSNSPAVPVNFKEKPEAEPEKLLIIIT